MWRRNSLRARSILFRDRRRARPAGEAYAGGLADLAKAFPQVSIGSYPSLRDGKFHNQIILRGRDGAMLAEAAAKVRAMLDGVA